MGSRNARQGGDATPEPTLVLVLDWFERSFVPSLALQTAW